jgi:hypothetical protein
LRGDIVRAIVETGGVVGHGRNDLTSLDHFAEGLAVGVFTDEAWVENVPCVTRQSSHPAKRTDGSATLLADAHSLTVCRY